MNKQCRNGRFMDEEFYALLFRRVLRVAKHLINIVYINEIDVSLNIY